MRRTARSRRCTVEPAAHSSLDSQRPPRVSLSVKQPSMLLLLSCSRGLLHRTTTSDFIIRSCVIIEFRVVCVNVCVCARSLVRGRQARCTRSPPRAYLIGLVQLQYIRPPQLPRSIESRRYNCGRIYQTTTTVSLAPAPQATTSASASGSPGTWRDINSHDLAFVPSQCHDRRPVACVPHLDDVVECRRDQELAIARLKIPQAHQYRHCNRYHHSLGSMNERPNAPGIECW